MMDPCPAAGLSAEMAAATRTGKLHLMLKMGNEDTHVVVENLIPGEDLAGIEDIRQFSYLAVYDGHGGSAASAYCARSMHDNLASILSKKYLDSAENGQLEPPVQDYIDSLIETFHVTEAEFCQWARTHNDNSGACALVVLYSATDLVYTLRKLLSCVHLYCSFLNICWVYLVSLWILECWRHFLSILTSFLTPTTFPNSPPHILPLNKQNKTKQQFVANAGDCGVYLFQEGNVSGLLNTRHTASDPGEIARLGKANVPVANGRVLDSLEPSRAIGDIDLKHLPEGVIATPEVIHRKLGPQPWLIVVGTGK